MVCNKMKKNVREKSEMTSFMLIGSLYFSRYITWPPNEISIKLSLLSHLLEMTFLRMKDRKGYVIIAIVIINITPSI